MLSKMSVVVQRQKELRFLDGVPQNTLSFHTHTLIRLLWTNTQMHPQANIPDAVRRMEDFTKVMAKRINSSSRVDDVFAFLCYEAARAFYFLGNLKAKQAAYVEAEANYTKCLAISSSFKAATEERSRQSTIFGAGFNSRTAPQSSTFIRSIRTRIGVITADAVRL